MNCYYLENCRTHMKILSKLCESVNFFWSRYSDFNFMWKFIVINKFHSFCWNFVFFHVNHYHWFFEYSLLSFVHVFCVWKKQSNNIIFIVENDIENDEFCDWFERRFLIKNNMNFFRVNKISICVAKWFESFHIFACNDIDKIKSSIKRLTQMIL